MRNHTIAFLAALALCPAAGIGQTPKGRTIHAIGYTVGGGGTTIDLENSGLVPQVTGEARVEARPGVTTVQAKVENLPPATVLGAEFLTYVLWAVSPEGRAVNMGGLVVKDGNGKLEATTQLQTFSLFVTAEPYSTVRQPSEMLILENAIRKGTKGRRIPVDNYQLMSRTLYQKLGNPLALSVDLKNVPIELYEARNAVDIARSRGAEKYAPDVFAKAEGGLKLAENALASKGQRKEIITVARQASQEAEDARALTVKRQEEERIEAERLAAASSAKAAAEAKAAREAAEAKSKADAEANRMAELNAAREARLNAEAELAAAKAKAEADTLMAKEAAAKADAERARRAADELRARLLDQFNRVLETRDTPRGLVITMADVLFDTGKYDLRSETREKLARLGGIVLAHEGLNLAVEGHTDSTGSDELNQKLSEQRASTVRAYLIQQGITESFITAAGFGKTMPVADNTTAAGRQQNRRVDLIVSGEVIGIRIGK
jgi:outer membrane protein OmpA-like peptidoglycan-associated protein